MAAVGPAALARRAQAAPAGTAVGTGSFKRSSYDRGFARAVERGSLTIGQAIGRGNRFKYASRLARRHGLSMARAFEVADGRLLLAAAIHAKKRADGERKLVGAELSTRAARWTVVPVLLLIVALAVLSRQGRGPNRAAPADARPAAAATVPRVNAVAEVHSDPQGRATWVGGADAESVARALCRSRSAAGTPSKFVDVFPAAEDAWVGTFAEKRQLYTIDIRRDARRDLWSVGNGKDPIVPSRLR